MVRNREIPEEEADHEVDEPVVQPHLERWDKGLDQVREGELPGTGEEITPELLADRVNHLLGADPGRGIDVLKHGPTTAQDVRDAAAAIRMDWGTNEDHIAADNGGKLGNRTTDRRRQPKDTAIAGGGASITGDGRVFINEFNRERTGGVGADIEQRSEQGNSKKKVKKAAKKAPRPAAEKKVAKKGAKKTPAKQRKKAAKKAKKKS